jgi:glutamyl/glutaminyl-tRNA synthetase
MAITHVVRGDDHISNTPKQILLYRALGAPVPRFAHVPLILGPDKKRLSKRHGATSVMEYQRQGHLPEAVVNFLALLGWSPGSDEELFTRDELISRFELEGIGGGNAVFNPEKLDWFNQQYFARLPPEDLAVRVRPWLEAAGVWRDSYLGERRGWFLDALNLLKPRARRLSDFAEQGVFLFADELRYDWGAIDKHLRSPDLPEQLTALDEAFGRLEAFDASSTDAALRSVAAARGVKAATRIHAVRVAVTGRAVSPGLFEVLALVGRQRTHERLLAALRIVTGPHA